MDVLAKVKAVDGDEVRPWPGCELDVFEGGSAQKEEGT